ncbi:adenylate/guanylate cyclase domain-containing protein [Actinomadura parmotrematis]|uniref:Adenylate/guanylate cyclase domain-containing protein n=1 Tax=Actinomadura parmotrematis TaxID=2864039 RepID=A0ABS7G2C6_9ACTN|nr:adenylate/guanylate cyclase domain-containing protein [Actinomadura parmotrematis]MBW8486869.1 adenylate/guanylate cyclase domain-containing protein [Actinomadura parmotrematis]
MAASAVAALALAAAAVLAVLLARERRRYAELLEATRPRPESGLLQGTQRAVQVAVTTASRLRRHGARGMLVASLDDLARWAAEDRAELVRVTAPDGTVTFVFTDIVDSTALNGALGDRAWVRLLKAHDRLVRREVTARGGHIVKSQGDGFMIAFGDPERALDAAAAIQRALAGRHGRARGGARVAVRIGVHRGAAVSRDGDYFGRAVAMAARVAAQADGGEILVSGETAAALPDPARLLRDEPRRASLKGFDGEHALHPVAWSAP